MSLVVDDVVEFYVRDDWTRSCERCSDSEYRFTMVPGVAALMMAAAIG